MSLPTHENPNEGRTASAPYNFVPLPEDVVPAVEDAEQQLPDQDRFHADRKTGYFEVTLTTKSPLYVRAMLARDEYERQNDDTEKDKPFQDRVKNKARFFHTGNAKKPVIPGSSLRGMLRNLLEVVSYGKIADVMAAPKMFFRAVAAAKDDPLADPYRDVLGKFSKNVRAGYLLQKGADWYIKPALSPKELNLLERSFFLSIKERNIPSGAIKGLVRLNSDSYTPQYHEVSFDAKKGRGKFGPVVHVVNIGPVDAARPYQGVMVCSGNMLETGNDEQKSPRSKFAIVLPAKNNAVPVKINPQAINDYLDSLTDFQKEDPFDKQMGFLKDGRPVFYVDDGGGEVFYFGHCPNFRIPAMLYTEKRAATPNDFVPGYCKNPETLDFAEAIFGHAKGPESGAKPGKKAYSYASRVFVTDAKCQEMEPWLDGSPFVPRILASPKPTAFQHYLVQPNPHNPRQLCHYGSPQQQTTIRGFKYYWRQGKKEAVQDAQWKESIEERGAEALDKIRNNPKDDTQHTRLQPVKPGTEFTFRVHFENLSEEELGALCWVLHPLGDENRDYCHSLGMGKPLGMGAVKLNATLHLTARNKRYSKLFDASGKWYSGVTEEEIVALSDRDALKTRIKPFEAKLLDKLKPNQPCQHLYQLRRIGMLLNMLEWPGHRPVPLESGGGLTNTVNGKSHPNTRYMTIRTPIGHENEYKKRPVLPDPSKFGELTGEAVPTAIPKVDPLHSHTPRENSSQNPKKMQPNDHHRPAPQDTGKKPHEMTPEAQSMLKSVEKQRQVDQAVAQSAYRDGDVEKKAKVIAKPDDDMVVALPKLPAKTYPLKPKRQFSRAKNGAKIRVRVVVDNNNKIVRAEEL